MGVLTDLVIADKGDATSIANSQYPLGQFSGIDIKGVDSVKLTTLHSILSGTTFKELLVQYDPVAEASEEGPWVFILPTDLVEQLASLDEAEIACVATKWGDTEEFRLDKWSLSAVTDVLIDIAKLARQASAQQKRIFAWVSL